MTATNLAQMDAAEVTIKTMVANGMDTLYCLPGVQNDDFFDALMRSGAPMRPVHTRHEQATAYMALGAALATGKPQAYCVVPGPGFLNTTTPLATAQSLCAPGARRFRPDLRAVHRQGHRIPARDPRPARDHADADQVGGAHRRAAGCSGQEPHGVRAASERRTRPGRSRMRLEHVEALGGGRLRRYAGRAPHAAPRPRRDQGGGETARRRQAADHPRRRRRPGRERRAHAPGRPHPGSRDRLPHRPGRRRLAQSLQPSLSGRSCAVEGRRRRRSASARASSTSSTGAATTR